MEKKFSLVKQHYKKNFPDARQAAADELVIFKEDSMTIPSERDTRQKLYS